METEWKVLPRGDVAPHWSGLYVTMNTAGSVMMSRVTHERFGAPEAVLILLDAVHSRLALEPAKPGSRNAYPVRNYGRRGGRIVRAYRMLTEFGIRPADTIEFLRPKIDADGRLILDLTNIRISPKAHSQCRKPPREYAPTPEHELRVYQAKLEASRGRKSQR
ncbi:MAG: hypothetical protein QUS14_11570 [Pyrinomonadaceae bacterium]|nr:hypothetical protein [Pyrinomonadaceae bacterium]